MVWDILLFAGSGTYPLGGPVLPPSLAAEHKATTAKSRIKCIDNWLLL